MPSETKVYVAGVGYSPSSSKGHGAVVSMVSAATKALLDAGITYDDVSCGVRSKSSRDGSKAFDAFDEGGIEIHKVESGSELESSFRLVKEKGVKCVLAIISEKSASIAVVLISEDFLWNHPYLKDDAALIRESSTSQSKSQAKGFQEICHIVWRLRGWSESQDLAGKKASFSYKAKSMTFELSRADSKPTPKWKDVEHKQDGKHRLRYNPAKETKEVSLEDFEIVRAEGKGKRTKKWDQFKKAGGDRAALAKL